MENILLLNLKQVAEAHIRINPYRFLCSFAIRSVSVWYFCNLHHSIKSGSEVEMLWDRLKMSTFRMLTIIHRVVFMCVCVFGAKFNSITTSSQKQ